MDCLNFKKKGNKLVFDSLEYEKYKEQGERIIHWLPKQDDLVDVKIFMPDTTHAKGLGENLMKKIQLNEVVQAERFGFVKLDSKKGDELEFWFTHK